MAKLLGRVLCLPKLENVHKPHTDRQTSASYDTRVANEKTSWSIHCTDKREAALPRPPYRKCVLLMPKCFRVDTKPSENMPRDTVRGGCTRSLHPRMWSHFGIVTLRWLAHHRPHCHALPTCGQCLVFRMRAFVHLWRFSAAHYGFWAEEYVQDPTLS